VEAATRKEAEATDNCSRAGAVLRQAQADAVSIIEKAEAQASAIAPAARHVLAAADQTAAARELRMLPAVEDCNKLAAATARCYAGHQNGQKTDGTSNDRIDPRQSSRSQS
jgi:hypothetical protein